MKHLFLLFAIVLSSAYAFAQPDVTGNVTNCTCYGSSDGSIDLTITNGSGIYSFTWTGPNNFNATTQNINGLEAGDYEVEVIDNQARSLQSINTIVNFTVTQPSEIVVTPTTHDESCYGANDASITLDVTGGTPGYTYIWTNGMTSQNLTNISVDPEIMYSEFWVTVTDANACTSSSGATVNAAPEQTYNIVTINANCGNADGEAYVDGLQGNYEVTWVNGATGEHVYNLTAGIYSVEINNLDIGCSTTQEFYIEDNTTATFTPNVSDATSPTTNDGQIILNISGGTAPFGVVWDNGIIGNINPNLYAGNYSATITDANGCLNNLCVSVGNLQEMGGSVSTSNTSTCSGVDGSATANVWGGQTPYGFLWDDPNNQTTQTASNLSAGIYHCIVSDAIGHQLTLTTVIGDNGGPTVSWENEGQTECGQNNGFISVNVSGGTAPYNYLWTNGQTTQDISNLPVGEYGLLVTDNSFPAACHTSYTSSIYSNYPNIQPICMVTVDSTTDHNLVIWENQASSGIDHYNIYRDNCDNTFNLIGTVATDAISVFEDISSLPFVKSYAYKISAVDNCGNESQQSMAHKTIHLKIVLNEAAGSAQLLWDDYIGFANPIFKLYKKTTDQGWILLSDVVNTEMSYTDLNYNDTTISYAVQVVKPDGGCDAWNGVSHVTGGPYYQSSSNIEDEGIVNHTSVNAVNSEFSIYPNPSNGILNIKSSETIKSVKIMDITGKTVNSFINIEQNNLKINTRNIKPGVYIMEVDAGQLIREQIIIE